MVKENHIRGVLVKFHRFLMIKVWHAWCTPHNIVWIDGVLCQVTLLGKSRLVTYGGWEIVGWYHQCHGHSPIYFPQTHTLHTPPLMIVLVREKLMKKALSTKALKR